MGAVGRGSVKAEKEGHAGEPSPSTEQESSD